MKTRPPSNNREPIVNLPGILTGFILILIAIHLWRITFLDVRTDNLLIIDYALIPARWSIAFFSEGKEAVLAGIRSTEAEMSRWQIAIVRHLLLEAEPKLWTAITHVFFHGSWLHLGFNILWMAAFGAPLARRWGILHFIIFCLLTAMAGAFAHFIFQPYSALPTIGVSGVVSGMFGASTWYVFDRKSGFDGGDDDFSLRPRLMVREIFTNNTTVSFIVLWLLGNYVFAAMSGSLFGADTEVAWQAHIGGFVGGFFLFPLLDDYRRKSENQ